PEQLESALELEVQNLASMILLSQADGTYQTKKLPREAQFSPIYGIAIQDFDADGKEDVLLAGNFYNAKPEVGRYDASYGLFLKGDGTGNFEVQTPKQSGFGVDGEVRDLESIKIQGKSYILVARNSDRIEVFRY
ncbi:MAG: hypothetical protein AAF849_19305, partial [Bacteroidota bacterium]